MLTVDDLTPKEIKLYESAKIEARNKLHDTLYAAHLRGEDLKEVLNNLHDEQKAKYSLLSVINASLTHVNSTLNNELAAS